MCVCVCTVNIFLSRFQNVLCLKIKLECVIFYAKLVYSSLSAKDSCKYNSEHRLDINYYLHLNYMHLV